MNLPDQRIAQAWLTAPDSGIIELTRDWTAAALCMRKNTVVPGAAGVEKTI